MTEPGHGATAVYALGLILALSMSSFGLARAEQPVEPVKDRLQIRPSNPCPHRLLAEETTIGRQTDTHQSSQRQTLAMGAIHPADCKMVPFATSSHVGFEVRLLWLKHVDGRFDQIHGHLFWSAQRHAGVVRAWIDVRSARMPSARFRQWLLGPEFLDGEQYPRIRFVSDSMPAHVLQAGGKLHGKLTLHGVTRPIEFTVQPSRCEKPGTTRCTLRLQGSVKRKDFGMRAHGVIVSNKVRLQLTIMLQRPAR